MNSNGNSTARWMAIIVPVLMILASLGITFATSNAKKITEHEKSLAVIENELKHLNIKMDEILREVRNVSSLPQINFKYPHNLIAINTL